MFGKICVSVLGLLAVFLNCDAQSPCPDVFEYRSDGAGVYGVIHLRATQPVASIYVRVNFTIAARLTSNYVGRIEPIGSGLLQDFNRGVPLMYRVHFPVTSPLPRLTSLIVNDNILCYGPGDIPGPTQYVSTISLQHMLYLKSGQGAVPGFINYEPRPNPVETNPNNQIYNVINTFNDDRVTGEDFNRGGVWNNNNNNNNYPTRRPEYERPVVVPQPSRPDYSLYYPEPTTQPAYVRPTPAPPPPRPVEVIPPTPPRLPASPPTTSVECGRIEGSDGRLPLIFNGDSYTRGDWPWLVAIYRRKDGSLTFICSGTLVSDRHVVSAAHCMHQKSRYTSQKDIVVKVGVYNLEDWGDEITVTRTLSSAIIHESYNTSTLANDILLLTFERSVEFNVYIRPACLWNGDTDLDKIVGKSGVVAGWGQSELAPSGHGEPRMVRIPVVSTSTCRASKLDFHKLTSANTLCAGNRNGVGPCLGDSGGGLYMSRSGRWRLRGVVSLSLRPESGESTCNLNEYIVFTDTAKYLSWITDAMYA